MPRKALLAVFTLLMAALTLPLQAEKAQTKAFDPDLLAGMRARSIGPAGMSGRVAAIAGVESDPETVWVGAASGGVWKSVDR